MDVKTVNHVIGVPNIQIDSYKETLPWMDMKWLRDTLTNRSSGVRSTGPATTE